MRGNHDESFKTFTGRYTWPLDPKAEDINLVDVAHSLAIINRYNGHTCAPYSVADHAVRVSHLVEELATGRMLGDIPHSPGCMIHFEGQAAMCSCGSFGLCNPGQVPRIAYWGLHHDDSEFLLVDFPRPMKHTEGPLGAEYRAAEERVMRCVCEFFSMAWPQPFLVDLADVAIRLAEQRDLMNSTGLQRLADNMDKSSQLLCRISTQIPTIEPRTWQQSEQAFYQRHFELETVLQSQGVN